MSPVEQAQLWQNPDYNQYHANYEPDLPGPGNSGYSFGTLHDLDISAAIADADLGTLTGQQKVGPNNETSVEGLFKSKDSAAGTTWVKA